MTTEERYQAAADWAEKSMALDAHSTSALSGDAEHGRAAVERAVGGRTSLDSAARPGQHSRVRQVRLQPELDTKLDERAAQQHIGPSQLMREALRAYLVDA